VLYGSLARVSQVSELESAGCKVRVDLQNEREKGYFCTQTHNLGTIHRVKSHEDRFSLPCGPVGP